MRRAFVLALGLLLPHAAAAAGSPAPPPAARSVPEGTPKLAAKVLAPPADSAAVMALLDGVVNRACPLPGVATGGQPAASHLSALAKGGYRVVVDLRTVDEPRGFDEVAAITSAGLEYIVIPFTASTLTDEAIAAFRKVMQTHAAAGVFVHCSSGNRIGGVMVPWLALDRGWELERAVASAKAGGMRSPALEAKARDYVARMRKAR